MCLIFVLTCLTQIWIVSNATHAPPAVKSCLYPFTTKPLSSVARWCMGNGTHAPPAEEKKSLPFRIPNVELDDFGSIW